MVGKLPGASLPLALAHLHWRTRAGSRLTVRAPTGDPARNGHDGGSPWRPDAFADVLLGAGFVVDAIEEDGNDLLARVTRDRSLPDTAGPQMRLLVCGLNPSEYAADRGVGYARPGNRFWPAALQAGVVTRSHDPVHALTVDGVGMTDLVKRATPRADLLDDDEYRAGAARVERLVRWLRPEALCFVGLAGWRVALDRQAVPGLQPRPFAGRPAYLMPSTSGLNAHATLVDLVEHLRAAAALGS